MLMDNSLLEEILRNNPSPTTLRILLNSLMNNGLYSRVIQEGTKALAANPDDVGLMLTLARAYEKLGFLGQAEDMLTKACNQLDNFAPMFKDLAKLYAKQSRHDDALASIKKYLAHFPDDSEALELVHRWQPIEEAPIIEDKLEEAVEVVGEESGPLPGPEAPSLGELATPTLAEIYFNQGQIEDAIQIYKSVLARHPDDYEAQRRLQELNAMIEARKQPLLSTEESRRGDDIEAHKEKIITVLTSWLGQIQEMSSAP